ncbi:hypothetical protein CAPTEDRAFT_197407 [Capitella teleta]|uniref:G-protein coupled receptors family 1 profile domain-containing protein n=1 Tax=Capitella teleta TaxID=283909 RepID=R7VI62_CAPTE|nr:hypothetical protein CAPTEDRAFT_197407 [Capitella teleta]|eukprot:ELU18538.1 hypothetical protein CAPTEDRAFT_197407 [Capitella teleta]
MQRSNHDSRCPLTFGANLQRLQSLALTKVMFSVIAMLISLLAIFIIAWGPFLTQALYVPIVDRTVDFAYSNRLFREAFTLLSFANATIDAFLIPIFSKQFRIAFARIFRLTAYVAIMSKPSEMTMTSTLTTVNPNISNSRQI